MKHLSKLVLVLSILAIVLTACVGQELPVQQSVAAASSSTPPLSASTASRTIHISGIGVVDTAPDIATINIGIHTEHENASTAVSENNRMVQNLMETLNAAGIEQIDMQTSNFSIWQNQIYNYDGTTSESTYHVDNTVFVTVRDLDSLGETLDSAVQAGANNINSIQFSVSDDSELLAQARALAVSNAQSIAQELAAASGVELGEIESISYISNAYPIAYYGPYWGMGGGGGESAVPITTGQVSVQATVDITYTIR